MAGCSATDFTEADYIEAGFTEADFPEAEVSRGDLTTDATPGADPSTAADGPSELATGTARAPLTSPTSIATPVPTAIALPTQVPDATATPTAIPPPTSFPPTPVPPSASADAEDTIYVAIGGSGNGASAETALGSITQGLGLLEPGMTLVINAGTYSENVMGRSLARGTPSRPIRVQTSGRVVVEGLVRIDDADYWDISGLNVTWPVSGNSDDHLVKLTGGTGWTFRDAEVWGAKSFAGVLVAGAASHYTLRGLYVHDTASTNGRNQDHLIYVNSTSGPGLVERNLLVGSPNGRAVKVGGAALADVVSDVVIDRNTMVDNLGPSNIQVSGATSSVTISNNIMVRPDQGRNAITAFKLTGTNIVASGNVVWQAAGVSDPEVVDLGGNVQLNPEFGPGFVPGAAAAKGAGYRAP